ncbi:MULTISPECIES: hypothetical protein [unclassified Acidiphilium]|uniref:hypothetical protein n=1 Tax=unclassified Acidiphilium TaxID=2617493 RepID=UPI000BCC96ED|nr:MULTISPECIES: hypothetical protein [unclassified Acidiphilium]OYV57448.1 MAG: hypothetical protein B7Z76_01350 [Acidiphilium sp. 20-67-58]HQT59687.1 hypothetical protein [Acidiphilium sp.]
MIEGAFITVVPGKFGFIAPEGHDLGNLYVTAGTLAALPRIPHRGDRARFKLAVMKDGRRRAIDVVLIEGEQ